jgi:hypothetical protein
LVKLLPCPKISIQTATGVWEPTAASAVREELDERLAE